MAGDLPDLPRAFSIRIKEDALAIPGPGRDLGAAGHRNQSPWRSAGGVDQPDLTLAGRHGIEGDFAAVRRPCGMEWQERLRRELTQPGAIRVSRPQVPMARTIRDERDGLPVGRESPDPSPREWRQTAFRQQRALLRCCGSAASARCSHRDSASTYASRPPFGAIAIWSDAPSRTKGASAPRPSIVTCRSSPVLIAPPPYTMVRLSGFHANVVIGTGLVTSSFGFPPGCGTAQSAYVAPFSQRRKASHRPSGEKAGETSCAASGPSVTGCAGATGKREPVQAQREGRLQPVRAYERFAVGRPCQKLARARAGNREVFATTCSGPPPAGITIAWSVSRHRSCEGTRSGTRRATRPDSYRPGRRWSGCAAGSIPPRPKPVSITLRVTM